MNNNNEPIVLGELKKENSSKPIFVIIVFSLVLGVCFGLPYIKDYFADDISFASIINEITGKNNNQQISKENMSSTTTTTTSTTTTTTTVSIVDDGLTLLKNDTVLNIDAVYLDNIVITNGNISYRISARETIYLDDANYYLEIYNENKLLLGNLKLSGVAYTASNIFNQSIDFGVSDNSYYLKLVSQNIVNDTENIEDITTGE